MKKVLTILAIMVVAVCAVFAADSAPASGAKETHKITVSTTVDMILPTFGFSASNGTDSVATNDDASSSEPAKFTANANHVDSTVLDTKKDISTQDVVQDFVITSLKIANYDGSFDLTVEASVFTAMKDASTVLYATTADRSYSYHAYTEDQAASQITTTAGTSKLTVEYNGRQIKENIKLGYVTVTWPQDTKAVPATYTADVVLTVTAC